jgi:hypothetical protein
MNLFLLKIQFRNLLKYFKKGKSAKIVTALLFFGVFFAVAFGIYEFFLKGFSYLHDFPYFENSLLLYSFELFFLFLGFLVWFGSMVSLLFGLFGSKTRLLLLISPKFNSTISSVIFGNFISSTWMFLFLMLPALWAVTKFFHLNFSAFIAISFTSILLLAILVVIAYCSIMLGAHILRTINKKLLTFRNLSILVGVLVFFGFILIGNKFSHHDIIVTLSVQDFKYTKAPLEPITSLFQWLPTNLAAEAITYAEAGDSGLLGAVVLKLIGLLVLLGALASAASYNFLFLWQQLSEGSHIATTQKPTKTMAISKFPLPKNGFQAVLYKEIILLFRNTKNLFWLLFLALLWLSYIGFNFSLQKKFTQYQSAPQLPKIILAMQLLVLVYFVSAMVLRFAFPSFSSERNTVWIFSSSPLSFKKLLWAKFLFFSSVFTIFSLLVEIFNVTILHLDLAKGGMFLWLSVCSAFFISALGLFFGAKFPNFETDDAQSLGTSIPGLVFTFASILYGALITLFYYAYISSGSAFVPASFAFLSIALAFALIQNAANSIEKIDFIINRS